MRDEAAAWRLAVANRPLVGTFLRENQGLLRYVEPLELENAALTGLWQAARRWCRSKGGELSTYAWYWMRAEVLRLAGFELRVKRHGAFRNAASVPLDDAEIVDPRPRPDEVAALKEGLELLRELVPLLGERRRRAVEAHLRGHADEVVAEHLGQTRQAVSAQRCIAIGELRELMGDPGIVCDLRSLRVSA